MTMGADPNIQPQPSIPTVFVTMRDGDAIQRALLEEETPLVVQAYMRPRPALNWSSILIWLLGVATVRARACLLPLWGLCLSMASTTTM